MRLPKGTSRPKPIIHRAMTRPRTASVDPLLEDGRQSDVMTGK